MKRPVPNSYPISQPFGVPAQVYIDLGYLGHHGTDIGTPIGVEVRAAATWECITAIWNDPTAGSFIVLKHPNGLLTRYLHLSRINVGVGDTGPEGHPIGLTGDTGLVIGGPHLHWEVIDPVEMDNGYKGRLDPELFLEEAMTPEQRDQLEYVKAVLFAWGKELQGQVDYWESQPYPKTDTLAERQAAELRGLVSILTQVLQ